MLSDTRGASRQNEDYMKTIMTRVSIVVSFVTVLLLVVGWHMQRQKANIDSLPAERFDYIMKLYYTGNTLITVAVCLAAIAVVCWIVTAIIRFRG